MTDYRKMTEDELIVELGVEGKMLEAFAVLKNAPSADVNAVVARIDDIAVALHISRYGKSPC